MASKAVVDAVSARIGATWNDLPVVLPNNRLGKAPGAGAGFIEVEFPVANTERMPVNQKFYREEGGFRIVVNAPIGDGLAQVLEWSDDLAALFRDQKFGGIETQVPGSPFIDDGNDNGNYFQASFAVPYTYNFTGA